MPASVKHVPALGTILSATSVPSRLCHALNPNESTRCVLAPHDYRSVKHTGYDSTAGVTITW